MQDRINIQERDWAPCSRVTVKDGVLHCFLAFDRTYDLTSAYENDLHIRLANAKTDDDLIAFVCEWGPLYREELARSTAETTLPMSHLRASQRWLRALLDLLTSFKRALRERESLAEFVSAQYEYEANSTAGVPPHEPIAIQALRQSFGINGDVRDWVLGTNVRTLRAAVDFLVPWAGVQPLLLNLVCRRRGKRRYVEAGWSHLNLEQALRWMVWQDEFTNHPLVCCQECRTVFRSGSAHARKYCGYDCAHRATARVWQRNKRKQSQKGR